ncbi:hypothetical protein Bca101_015499 [Brassica carinata]
MVHKRFNQCKEVWVSGSYFKKRVSIYIWDGNASREYLDGIGLTEREEGDLGPVYIWISMETLWYTDMHADYTGQGFDQLLDVFYVANGELSCQMYQRSADMGLGVPFNIASYSLLTCILAHVCDLVPGDFIHVIADAHVYKNHVRPLQEQLENPPKPFPVLKINPEKKHIDSFVAADFQLIGYDPHKKIDMKMAV